MPPEAGSKRVLNQRLVLSGVQRLACDLPIQLRLMQGAPESLSLTADDNLLDWLDVAMLGPELRLSWKEKSPKFRDFTLKGQLLLRAPQLVKLSGVADLEATALNLPSFSFVGTEASQARFGGQMREAHFRVADAAQVKGMNLHLRSLQAEGSGAAQMSLRVSDRLQAGLSGSASLESIAAPTRQIELNLVEAAQAYVWAQEELTATVADASSLRHRGQTKKLKISPSGTAEVVAESSATPINAKP